MPRAQHQGTNQSARPCYHSRVGLFLCLQKFGFFPAFAHHSVLLCCDSISDLVPSLHPSHQELHEPLWIPQGCNSPSFKILIPQGGWSLTVFENQCTVPMYEGHPRYSFQGQKWRPNHRFSYFNHKILILATLFIMIFCKNHFCVGCSTDAEHACF